MILNFTCSTAQNLIFDLNHVVNIHDEFQWSDMPPQVYSGEFDIEWIELSYENFEDEKSAIKVCLKDDFDTVKLVHDIDTDKIPIAIGLYDLNYDGNPEIVAVISNSFFHGVSQSGGLFVFKYDGSKITAYTEIAGFKFDLENLGYAEAKQIGVIRKNDGWDDLYVNNLYWSSEPYIFK
jgi:hypothetical protein